MNGARRILPVLARLGYLVVFGGLLLAIAFGSAGIVALWAHPPGTAARAELTWKGDAELGHALDASQVDLVSIATATDRLSVLARGAIGALTADDPGPFGAALTEGATVATSIERDSAALRDHLSSLPGAGTFDVLHYAGELTARRLSLITALDATQGLGRSWATLTAGGLRASALLGLLAAHDTTVGTAAAEGRAGTYEAAISTLDTAIAHLDDAVVIRDQLANTTDVSTLDEWIQRNRTYDEALRALYAAFRDSGGVINDAVRAAYVQEGDARAALPPDDRGLVVIIADIGRGGLNQAVIAIDQARARLTLAIQGLSAP